METTEIVTCEINCNLLATFEQYNFPKDFDCGLPLIDEYFNGRLRRALKSENVKASAQLSATISWGFAP